MNVTADTTIHELIEAYPYLLDWLVEYDAHFDALKNPVLYNTMARVAKLETAASMAHVPVATLLEDVRTEIAHREIAAEEAAGIATPSPLADDAARAARTEALKSIILKLHDGTSVADVKAEFDALATGIDSAEIARMEQALIAEGMPIEDVQRLCDVHVTVFRDSLDTHETAEVDANHPLDAYRRENVAAALIVGQVREWHEALNNASDDVAAAAAREGLSAELATLAQIETHYIRKENQLFPVLETHDVSGPTKVMWALDDDIRGRIKSARALVAAGDVASLAATLPETLSMIDDMIYKEEKILFPTSLQMVTDVEWARMAAGDAQIGYAWVEGPEGDGARAAAEAAAPEPGAGGAGGMLLPLPTGALSLAQLDLLFRALPFDVTYVDENDRVRFYSEGERVFPRSPGAIGRDVHNCHPPASVHKVIEILDAFKDGSKDSAEFWIEMGPKFVHIRYFALRDAEGTYQGCLEVVHDATHVRSLSGNRRIVDW